MRLLAFIFLLAMSSCGVFRDVEKHKETRKEKVSLKVDSVVNIETNTKDQSKIVVQEKGKGLYNPPSFSASWSTSFNPDSTIRLKLIKTNFGLISIATSLNNLGNGIDQEATFEPFPVPIDYERNTTMDLDIETNEQSSLGFQKEEERELKEMELDVKKEGKNLFWFVVGGLMIFLVIYRIFKSRI